MATDDSDRKTLIELVAGVVVERLASLPRDSMKIELAEMLRRHLRVRKIVSRAFEHARTTARTVRQRGGQMPDIAGATRALQLIHTSTMVEALASLCAADIATTVIRSGSSTAELLAAFERRAVPTGEVYDLLAFDLENARDAMRVGMDVRMIGYSVAIQAVTFWLDHESPDRALAIRPADLPGVQGTRPADHLALYMITGMNSKTNAPQQVVAVAMAKLGFGDADIFNLVREAKRTLDPTANVSRSQIFKLTRPYRARSAQRHRVRA